MKIIPSYDLFIIKKKWNFHNLGTCLCRTVYTCTNGVQLIQVLLELDPFCVLPGCIIQTCQGFLCFSGRLLGFPRLHSNRWSKPDTCYLLDSRFVQFLPISILVNWKFHRSLWIDSLYLMNHVYLHVRLNYIRVLQLETSFGLI